MTVQLAAAVIQRILQQWRELPEAARPWGVWITLHDPIQAEADSIRTPPRVVWFWKEQRLHPLPLWDYLRFEAVQLRPPRHTGIFGGRYGLGLACFAPLADTEDILLEVTWDRLYGKGCRLHVDKDGTTVREEGLWIS